MPSVRVLILACFILFIGGAVYPAVWSFWANAVFDWDPRMIGLSLAAYGVSNTITQAVLVGIATKRLGERRAALWALALNVGGFVLTGLCTRSWMVFVVIVATAPAGISMPALQAWMSKMTPADAQGRLQGMVGGAEGLSSIIGPIVMSQTFGAFEHCDARRAVLPGGDSRADRLVDRDALRLQYGDVERFRAVTKSPKSLAAPCRSAGRRRWSSG